MGSRIHRLALATDPGEFADEIRQVFHELSRNLGPGLLAGECLPSVDIVETDDTLDIVVDLPGVGSADVRVVAKADAILIVGEKPARRATLDCTFHLVEREFGRFARVIRLGLPCDTSRASAHLSSGELRVVVPKIKERRGRSIPITVGPR